MLLTAKDERVLDQLMGRLDIEVIEMLIGVSRVSSLIIFVCELLTFLQK